jgi:hypothetical protein
MSAEPLPIVTCACGWPRPLIAVTRIDGELPEEALAVTYDCPQCARVHRAGELSVSRAQHSPRARRVALAGAPLDMTRGEMIELAERTLHKANSNSTARMLAQLLLQQLGART